jgi:hypothetical protein
VTSGSCAFTNGGSDDRVNAGRTSPKDTSADGRAEPHAKALFALQRTCGNAAVSDLIRWHRVVEPTVQRVQPSPEEEEFLKRDAVRTRAEQARKAILAMSEEQARIWRSVVSELAGTGALSVAYSQLAAYWSEGQLAQYIATLRSPGRSSSGAEPKSGQGQGQRPQPPPSGRKWAPSPQVSPGGRPLPPLVPPRPKKQPEKESEKASEKEPEAKQQTSDLSPQPARRAPSPQVSPGSRPPPPLVPPRPKKQPEKEVETDRQTSVPPRRPLPQPPSSGSGPAVPQRVVATARRADIARSGFRRLQGLCRQTQHHV